MCLSRIRSWPPLDITSRPLKVDLLKRWVAQRAINSRQKNLHIEMLCIFHLISGMLLLADDGHRVGKDCDEAPKVLAKASRAVVFKCLKKDIKGFE